MFKTFSIEWMKARKYVTFWLLFGFFALGAVGLNYIVYVIRQSIQIKQGTHDVSNQLFGAPFAFPDVWQTVAWLSGYMLFLPGLTMITLITNEYTYKTHRQNIIDGWTRGQFVTNKVIWALLLAIGSTIVVFLTAMLMGSFSGQRFTTENLQYIPYFFLECLTYMLVAGLFAFLLKRSGLALGLFFVYILIIKNTIAFAFNFNRHWTYGDVMPMTSSDSLIPFPFLHEMLKGQRLPQHLPFGLLMGLTVFYILLFTGLVFWKFQRDDL